MDPILSSAVEEILRRHPDDERARRAHRVLDGPLRVAVRGRPGTGRDTLARALRDQLAVAPIVPGDDLEDADVWCHALVGWPRSEDLDELRRLPLDRTVVVLAKADTLGGWDEAIERAQECAARIGMPVTPVMSLLACVDLSDDEVAFLHEMVATGETVPSMAATFVVGESDERMMRTRLLRRLDQYGLLTACDEIADALAVGRRCATAQLNALLARESGVAALRPVLEDMWPTVVVHRREVVAGLLDRIAASGVERDAIEATLAGVRG
ncbi:hypothetical protein LX14_001738 [Williamsia deligens]|nr:hypothetical protein [Williamsia deligens]